jgi:hypothetical protein
LAILRRHTLFGLYPLGIRSDFLSPESLLPEPGLDCKLFFNFFPARFFLLRRGGTCRLGSRKLP